MDIQKALKEADKNQNKPVEFEYDGKRYLITHHVGGLYYEIQDEGRGDGRVYERSSLLDIISKGGII